MAEPLTMTIWAGLIASQVGSLAGDLAAGALGNELHARVRQAVPWLAQRLERNKLPADDPLAEVALDALRDALMVLSKALHAMLDAKPSAFVTLRRWMCNGADFEDPSEVLTRGAQAEWLKRLREKVRDKAALASLTHQQLVLDDECAKRLLDVNQGAQIADLLHRQVSVWLEQHVGPMPTMPGLTEQGPSLETLLRDGWPLEVGGTLRVTLYDAWRMKFRQAVSTQPQAFNNFVTARLTDLAAFGLESSAEGLDADALVGHLQEQLEPIEGVLSRLEEAVTRIEHTTNKTLSAVADLRKLASQVASPTARRFEELPALQTRLIGREDAVDEVIAALHNPPDRKSGVVTIAGLAGMGGVGKTAVALAAAHALREEFPGGRLFFALGGHSGQPVSGAAARRRWLQRAAPESSLPDDEEALAVAYRQQLAQAGGPVLGLVDDLTDGNDIDALLPRAGDAMLLTSRNKLAGYAVVELDVLSSESAMELLTAHCRRLETDSNLQELAERCARLPIALEVASKFLARRTSKPTREYLEELRTDRLSALSRSNPHGARLDVEVVLTSSIKALDHVEALVLFNLSVLTANFSRDLGMQVAACSGHALDTLVEAGLLTFDADAQRFSMHDLIRELALKSAEFENLRSARERHAEAITVLMTRWNKKYMEGGMGIVESIRAYDTDLDHVQAAFDFLARDSDRDPRWLVRESAHIRAIRQARSERIRWEGAAIEAANRTGDRRSLGFHSGNLGTAFAQIGDDDQAILHFTLSLAISREFGEWWIEANQLANLAGAKRRQGRLDEALKFIDLSIAVRQTHLDRKGEATELSNKGNILRQQGHTDRALRYHTKALSICEEYDDVVGLVHALGNVASDLMSLERHGQALPHLERATSLAVTIRDERNEGWLLALTAQVRLHLGDVAAAQKLADRALTISAKVIDPTGVATARCIRAQVELAKIPPGLAEARRQLEAALVEAIPLRQPELLESIFGELCETSLRQNDVPSAKRFAFDASRLLEAMDATAACRMREISARLERLPGDIPN